MRIYLLIFIVLFSTNAFSKVKVFTTTTNLADVARQIGGDQVVVESLCKGTQDPHYLEAKPSYTFKLSKADLLISIGADLEVGWLPLVIRGSRNPNIREGQPGHLVASSVVSLLGKDSDNTSRSMGDVHPEGNPHFMLSPLRSVDVARAVSKKLTELRPEHSNFFRQRLNNYELKIKKMLKILRRNISIGKKVITYHKTLTYFYDDFRIENIDVLEPKPGVPPSAAHIMNVIKKIKKFKVKTIVIENYFDDAIAKRIKRDVPEVEIAIVPVTVEGQDGISSIFDLYEYLAKRIGGQ